MATTANSLTAEHQVFIDDLTTLTEDAKTKLIQEFTKAFDLEAVLNDPEYAKKLMAELQFKLEDYLAQATDIGNQFGAVKEEAFNADSDNT